ncbi:MAG TPA: c(7)-type cytochrome triheme domain-containing protein [Usitatibacter sp.]|nr:c(7)-type cytochrome triheme domain-containing protein [Usitatibacter sp.]
MKRAWMHALLLAVLGAAALDAPAEYGDVVLNRRAEKEGVRPVVFPHWFHRVRFRCNVCHQELGFKMRAGSNDVTMKDIVDGKFCGMCHNGEIAWNTERCDLCHSGKAGLKSGIYGGHHSTGPGVW